MSEDEDGLDLVGQIGTEHSLVVGEGVLPHSRPGTRLGQQWPASFLGQGDGVTSGTVTGDDDGVRRHEDRGRRPDDPVHDSGLGGHRMPRFVGDERVTESDVEMDRPGVRGQRPTGSRHGTQHEPVETVVSGEAGGNGAEEPRCRSVNPFLGGGLVGAGLPHLVGTIGRAHDERNSAGVGLQHRGMQVGHRCPRGRHDHGRAPQTLHHRAS